MAQKANNYGNSPVASFPGGDADRYPSEGGISLREHYAGLAMQGMLAYSSFVENADPTDVASKAFDYADAMCREAERRCS